MEITKLKDLKLFALHYVYEHNLSVEENKYLCDFIMNSNEGEITGLLLTGNTDPQSIQEYSGLSVKIFGKSLGTEWFEYAKDWSSANALVNKTLIATAIHTLSAVALVAGIAFIGSKVYKRFLSKAAKMCGGRKGTEKTACINKYKIDAIKGRISLYQNGMKFCSKSKDVSKCRSSLQKKITKLKAKLGQY